MLDDSVYNLEGTWMKYLYTVIVAAVMLFAFTANGQDTSKEKKKENEEIIIGLSIDDLRLERWQKDRDLFVAQAKKLGAKVIVQSANGEDAKQMSQTENLLSQGVDILVIIPHSSDAMASAVDSANKQGVPVIAYDRIITNSNVNAYISFDNIRVGEMQAEYLVNKVPQGNYFLIGGSPTDNNAKLFRKGQMNILQPLIDKGDIKVVGDQWAKDWQANEAMSIMENGLTSTKNKVDAVVASNDSTAGGAIQALASQGMDGDVVVSGQDADLAGLQRIAEGKQAMTVYKPVKTLATEAAKLADRLARGKDIEANGKTNNGKIDVPSILLDPISVDQTNIKETVVKDGFQEEAKIYKNSK